MTPAAVTHLRSPRQLAAQAADTFIPLSTRISIVLLILWTVSQVVAMIPTLPTDLRKVLMAMKVLIGPMAYGLVAVIARPSLRISHATRAFLFFAALSAFNLLARSEPNWPRAALCVAWAASFVIIPAVLNDMHRLRVFVLWSVRGILASVAFAIAMALIDGENIINHRDRYVFGMGGNYFGGLATSLLFAGFALRVLQPDRHATLARFALVSGVILTLLTKSRTDLIMVVVFFLVFGSTSTRSRWRRASLALLTIGATAVLITAMLVGTTLLPYQTVDEFSSGRLNIWRLATRANLSGDDPAAWLWGNGVAQFDWLEMRKGWHVKDDPLTRSSRATSLFRRSSIDNSYLDILYTTGLIGLLMGLHAWRRWWVWLSSRKRTDEEGRVLIALAKAFIAGTLVASLTAARWPAMGSLIVTFSLVFCIGITAVLRRDPDHSLQSPREDVQNWNPPGKLR